MQLKVHRLILTALIALTAATVGTQTVYKCRSKETVIYSHEPCIGAEVVDTTPTQGLDKSSGKSRKGADVRRSEENKMMSDALRPIFGETPEQREKRHRRFKLSPKDRLECDHLDARLPKQEAAVRTARSSTSSEAELKLFETRKKFRELRC
jgi:hypothetical protein